VSGYSIRARPPAGHSRLAVAVRDTEVLASRLEDAAHFVGGHATELFTPTSEAEVAAVLRLSASVLPIGAQSSLTGGATPMGDAILSTARLNRMEFLGADRVRVQAGVTIAALDEALRKADRLYPPAPTFTGAFVGGTIATNAAGAATFKYGTTRQWVEALTVVLPSGDVLDIERGATRACREGYFDLTLADRPVRLEIPRYRMPALPKLSAGYFAAPEMDLIDLFIGSEGTLGIVTAATLRILPRRPNACLALVPFSERHRAFDFGRRLRNEAMATRQTGDPAGIDVAAIEHMDARCLELLREDGVDRANGVELPPDATIALLVTLELPAGTGADRVYDDIGRVLDADAPDSSIRRFCSILTEAGVFDRTEIAMPGDRTRATQLLAIREGVPASVNKRVGQAQRDIDPRISKTAADMIVPFDRLEALLDFYTSGFRQRGLDAAIWGHLSDGNLHPNVIPRSAADVDGGNAVILESGREAIRLGGATLAEHGVGRNPVKQELLRLMYGDAGIEEMRRVKNALDPEWKLSRGVLFPPPTAIPSTRQTR
jgi:D-lactate dehydrogenase (cytochrome)